MSSKKKILVIGSNGQIGTVLTNKLGETPISTELINQLQPLMFHNAQLKGFSDWRKNVDTSPQYMCVALSVADPARIPYRGFQIDGLVNG